MKLDQLSSNLIVIGFVFYTSLILFCLNVPFFWDTILTSSIAHWFYDHGVQNAIPPIKWDAGHPTFFQIYIYSLWKLFGKTLAVSHLSMLPFLYTIVVSFVYLLQKITTNRPARIVGMMIFVLHPYILTQSTLVSYDIVQLAFFLIFIIGFIEKRKYLLIIGTFGMSICSVRGQLFALIAWLILFIYERQEWRKYLLPALLASTPIIFWNIYHYIQTGWMLTTPSVTWINQRDLAQLHHISSNIIGIIRTFIDYGTIALSILFLAALYYYLQHRSSAQSKIILYITSALLVTLAIILISFSNPVAHRYFIIIHTGMILFVVSQWPHFPYKKLISSSVFITLVSGHFWLYPKENSNGWDVTLKYLSYEKSRKEFQQYLSDKNIPIEHIATAFPLFCSNKQTNLLEDNQRLIDISLPEGRTTEYVAFSAVCNDMREVSKQDLKQVQVFGKGKTAIILYLRETDY